MYLTVLILCHPQYYVFIATRDYLIKKKKKRNETGYIIIPLPKNV